MGADMMGMDNRIFFYLREKAISEDMRVIAESLEKTGDKYIKLLPDEPDLETAISIFGTKKELTPFFKTKMFTYGVSSSEHGLIISTSQGTLDNGYTVLDNDGKEMSREDAEKMRLDNAKRFIEIGMVVWNALRETPYFGAGDSGYSLNYYDDYKEAAKHTNWINFYGPELVKKHGKEKLLKAPAYKIKEIRNGLLIINSMSPFIVSYGEKDGRKEVRNYLVGRGIQ
jgi:hypothetical protein